MNSVALATKINLTGDNIQTVLDTLLFNALRPIVLNSDIFDTQLIHVLGIIAKNKKRKLTSLPRNRSVSLICELLKATDRHQKYKIITELKLERRYIHSFIARFLEETSGFYALYEQSLRTNKKNNASLTKKLEVLASFVGFSNSEALFYTIHTCRDFLDEFYSYRNSVVDLYIKHASKQAHAYCQAKQNNYFDFNDVHQNFLSAVTRAIDRYDSSKGALTSYINYWILNAQTCSTNTHEYNIAYTLPQSKKKRIAIHGADEVNYSVSLDTLHSDSDSDSVNMHNVVTDSDTVHRKVESDEQTKLIRYLVKSADINGCARLTLDIDEYFNRKELKRMRKFMRYEDNRLNRKQKARVVALKKR
jgi:hypothetical protein